MWGPGDGIARGDDLSSAGLADGPSHAILHGGEPN
jgi:hypothetical protein